MAVIPHTENFSGRTVGQGEEEMPNGVTGAQYYVPDNAARLRLDRYLESERMLDLDEHEKLYQEENGRNHPPERWLPIDFAGMLGRLVRQYTFGEEFSVSAAVSGSDPAVRRITERNQLFLKFRQATEMLPALGDAVFKVELVDSVSGDQGEALVRYVRPHHYFPQLDPLDHERVESVTLAWVFQLSGALGPASGDDTGPGKGSPGVDVTQSKPHERMGVLREVHTPGRVEYMVNRWDGAKLGAEMPVRSQFPDLEDYDTGLDDIAVVHVGYQTRAGHHFGCSEFGRVKPLMLALENRLSQEDEVLDKHARPKLIVGPGVLDEEAKSNLADFDVIEVEPDILEKAVRPEYLTWDMQVGGITHELEKLEEYLFITTETSPASFGLERDGSQVESARALRFKAHRTINKVEDIRAEWLPAIKKIYQLAQQLEVNDGADYEVSPVLVDFGSAIVEDQTQEVQDYVGLKAAGLVSRKRAVRDLFDLTETGADEEVREILQDEVDEAAVAATPATPAPAEFRQPGAAATPPAAPEPEPTPGTPAGDAGLGVAEGIQQTLLNGAQVSAMVQVVTSVAAGTLPRDSGLQILQAAFGVSEEEAQNIMGEAGNEPPPEPEPAADDAFQEAEDEDVEPAEEV